MVDSWSKVLRSSSVTSEMPHRGHKLVMLVAVQSLLIVWLGSWAVGDYMNNQYVRAYVDGTIQDNILILGAVIFVGILGSVGGLFFKRRGRSTLELVNVKTPRSVSTPVVASKLAGSSGGSALGTSPTPSVELHPAVAALKAEMSERRVALGLNPGMLEQAQGPASPPSSQSTPSSVASLLPPDIRALAENSRGPVPSTGGASASQSPPVLQTAQPSVPPPRFPMPTLSVSRPPLANPPMVRQGPPPGVPVPRPVQPTVQPARPPAVIPQNVTTVITGIMPKKKDPNDPNEQKSSGQ